MIDFEMIRLDFQDEALGNTDQETDFLSAFEVFLKAGRIGPEAIRREAGLVWPTDSLPALRVVQSPLLGYPVPERTDETD